MYSFFQGWTRRRSTVGAGSGLHFCVIAPYHALFDFAITIRMTPFRIGRFRHGFGELAHVTASLMFSPLSTPDSPPCAAILRFRGLLCYNWHPPRIIPVSSYRTRVPCLPCHMQERPGRGVDCLRVPSLIRASSHGRSTRFVIGLSSANAGSPPHLQPTCERMPA